MKVTLLSLALLAWLVPVQFARAESALRGDLPRAGNRPLEKIPGLDSIYDVLTTRDGVRLRTILTKPEGRTERLPAILFVQWLSCDSIELPASSNNGWSRMMRRVAQESGMVMMRTEKRGVGDSQGGACSALDYQTELSDHREAMEKLKSSEFVDAKKVFIFGASIGGTYAPLVALNQNVAGIVVWGAGARNWFERMLYFERNFRELSGVSGDTLNEEMKKVTAFLFAYLIQKKTPRQIAMESPALDGIWPKIVGTEGDLHYGRPISFHQQAQEQDWTLAWSQVRAPVLVFYAEYDWYEDAASAQLIARLVNRSNPGKARFEVIPRLDHHFEAYSRREDAVNGEATGANEDPVVREIVTWLQGILGPPSGGALDRLLLRKRRECPGQCASEVVGRTGL